MRRSLNSPSYQRHAGNQKTRNPLIQKFSATSRLHQLTFLTLHRPIRTRILGSLTLLKSRADAVDPSYRLPAEKLQKKQA
ncbi:MAG: hypothetical protein QNJ47_26625, partial [Nostocaceae cyanobacterium]|nr:hypothetical protein [Nostocaceae cyanobacterium]